MSSEHRCVLTGYQGGDEQTTTWCGRKLKSRDVEWTFTDPTHLLLALRQHTFVTPCAACVTELSKLLTNELDDHEPAPDSRGNPVYLALETILQEFDKCQKGCCQAPATRDATYLAHPNDPDGPTVPVVQSSCDEHGREPATDYDEAGAIRTVIRDANARGFRFWWQDSVPSKGTP